MIGEEKPSLEELAHFGVKGMRWGLRRGSSTTGIGRLRSASAQSLMDESRRRNTANMAGKIGNFGYGLVRGSLGTKKTAQRQQDAAKRILAGKTRALDVLRVVNNVRIADLFITTSLTPGARDYNGDKSKAR